MKFDFVIGNPPYQDNALGENATYAPPVYNVFMDAAYEVSDKVELIHPARFLFNAGSTPKAWNQKMLNDEHFKVMLYEEDASKIFPNTEIKGGVAITYHDTGKCFGAIETFTPHSEMASIMKKITGAADFDSISNIVFSAYSNKFTGQLHKENPNVLGKMSKGHAFDLKSNVFEKIPEIFLDNIPDNPQKYYKFLGLIKNQRVYRYINSTYIEGTENLKQYKIFMSAANGSGAMGETLSSPVIGEPFTGATESFISIGSFCTYSEAEALMKYVKTKFSRVLLGILKKTQHITPDKWKYVPLQNFTPASDIDWSQSVANIDKQLYKKYNLSKEEIDFIERNVKEME